MTVRPHLRHAGLINGPAPTVLNENSNHVEYFFPGFSPRLRPVLSGMRIRAHAGAQAVAFHAKRGPVKSIESQLMKELSAQYGSAQATSIHDATHRPAGNILEGIDHDYVDTMTAVMPAG